LEEPSDHYRRRIRVTVGRGGLSEIFKGEDHVNHWRKRILVITRGENLGGTVGILC
jgi:hypothetical protein